MNWNNMWYALRQSMMQSSGRAFKLPDATEGEAWLVGWGTTVPVSAPDYIGWAPGAIFIDYDAAAGAQVWYNTGTSSIAVFAAAGTTFASITGTDASLGITGFASTAGGAIAILGGTGSAGVGGAITVDGGTATGAYAGGAVTLTGGTAGVTGNGGAASLSGGVSVAGATGDGGALTLAGGASASTAGAGGAVSIAGGAGTTTDAGGAVGIASGKGGTTGAGGALTITAGQGGDTSGNPGNVTITGAAGNGTANGAGGTGSVVGGAGKGTGAGGAVDLTGGDSGAGATGNGGAAAVEAGAATSTAGNGGAASVTGGLGTTTGDGGAASLIGGASGTTGVGGAITITSGASSAVGGTAGAVTIDTGALNTGTGAAVSIAPTNATHVDVGMDLRLPDSKALQLGSSQDAQLEWDGTSLNFGPSAAGLWTNCPLLAYGDPNLAHGFHFDFHDVLTLDGNFLSTDDGVTGTNTDVDAVPGAVGIVTAAEDNDYHAMVTGSEGFQFAAAKKLWFETRFRLVEANTNESAWWFGFTDTLTTGGIQANALGPLASYDGALIWKDEGTMSIDFETSNAASQATGADIDTFVSNTWTQVGFYFDGTGTTSTITPYVDGTAYTAQNITLAGLDGTMHFVMGVKAGPTGGAETLEIDYVKVVQLR